MWYRGSQCTVNWHYVRDMRDGQKPNNTNNGVFDFDFEPCLVWSMRFYPFNGESDEETMKMFTTLTMNRLVNTSHFEGRPYACEQWMMDALAFGSFICLRGILQLFVKYIKMGCLSNTWKKCNFFWIEYLDGKAPGRVITTKPFIHQKIIFLKLNQPTSKLKLCPHNSAPI